MSKAAPIQIALVDDHKLFRRGMSNLLEEIDVDVNILFEADNGVDLQKKLLTNEKPELILMDINMPEMNGYQTMEWLSSNHPDIKVLIISMVEHEDSVVRMVKLGVKGYLSKDVEPAELSQAITSIINKGFYYTDHITGRLVHGLQQGFVPSETDEMLSKLSAKELKFIELACSDKTYNEIASEMFLSPKTIDGYRMSVFEKLNVKSRVAMALFAIKFGLVKL